MPNYLYTVGTASVVNNSDVVTGDSTAWSGISVKPGDTMNIAGQSVIVKSVVDATHLKLSHPWSWGAASSVSYSVIQNSPAWGQVRELSASVSSAIEKLNVSARVHISNGVPDNGYAVTHNVAIDRSQSPPGFYVSNGSVYTPVGYVSQPELSKYVPRAENFLSTLWVVDEITALPASPADNVAYIVKVGSPAPLDVKANKIAFRKDGAWIYYDPPKHVDVHVEAKNEDWRWDGTSWSVNNGSQSISYLDSSSVPTSLSTPVLILKQPHLRTFVWNGSSYIRAPWHSPGQVGFFSHNNAIAGWLPARGDVSYNQADYPDLVAALGLSGTGTFSVVELRGEYIRCLDNGRNVDVNRMILSWQPSSHIAHDDNAQEIVAIPTTAEARAFGLEPPHLPVAPKIHWTSALQTTPATAVPAMYSAVNARNVALATHIMF